MIDLGLAGKRVLVAVAGHRPPRPGFGRAVALKLADCGARVACLDVDDERAEAVLSEVEAAGGEAVAIVADLTERDQEAGAIGRCVDAFDGIDVCIDIVGGTRWAPVLEFDDDDDWHWSTETNLRQNLLLLQLVGRQMVAQGTGGSMASVAYGAAKAGLISLTKMSAEELGLHGIRVNAVAIGGVGTGNEGETDSLERGGRYRLEPLGPPRNRDIANALIFFASDLSERITGQTLLVDGGVTVKSPFLGDVDFERLRAFSGG